MRFLIVFRESFGVGKELRLERVFCLGLFSRVIWELKLGLFFKNLGFMGFLGSV